MKSQFLKSLLVALLVVFGTHSTGYADIIPVPDRTPQVRDAIVAAVLGVNSASDVTETHLATITNLNLRAKGISALKTGDFSGMTNLTNLNLYGNQLSSLPDRIFEGLTALTKLRLAENQLTTLPAGVFSGLTGLRDLYLHNNRLTNLPADVFSGLSALIQINLHTNRLTSLPKGVFSGLSALTQLYLHNNQLTSLDAEVFSRLSALQFLFLHNNQLTSLDAEVFSRLSALEFLFLNGNRLTNLSPGMFRGVSTPASLWLQDNVIDPLPLTLLLEKVGENELKVSVPAGAPFSIELPLTVTNGSIAGGTTRITVAAGSVESQPVTIIRTPGTTDTVTVEIGTLPNTRSRHKGYALVKSSTLPIFRSINNAPVFTEGTSTKRTVAENTGSGVNIGSAVSATDADDDQLTYSLSGTDALSFGIDSSSGQLRTRTALDYETKSSYSVTVSVSDGNEGSDSIPVTISVTDVDETPANRAPVFTEGSRTTRTVVENTTSGVNIGSAVSAPDTDDDTLTYRLGGPDAAFFSIDSTSGQLQTEALLDYEAKALYTVTVSVSDGNQGSASITVTIRVTDVNEAPVFDDGENTTRAISENVGADINIGPVVAAKDPDGDTLTYSLGGTDAPSFRIGSTTGQLKTTNTELDFETKSAYSVTITVSDEDNLRATISVTIKVTDLDDETPSNNAPVFTDGEQTTRRIAENTVAGTNIGAPVSAIDADNNPLAYVLQGDDAASFSIDFNTGQLKTSAALNHETQSAYLVIVKVLDGGLTDTIDVTITVDDVNDAPVFTAGNRTLTVEENTASATNIGNPFTATDEDDDTLTYRLVGSDAGFFSINSSSGQLRTNAVFDYEEGKHTYTVTVSVSDGNDGSASINVTITVDDVNDAPVFVAGSLTRRIAENTVAGTNIGAAFTATDEDDDTLTYGLVGSDAGFFSINSSSGQLRTNAVFDYEEDKHTYTVTVSVSDGNDGSASINVTITVDDVNDAPVFTAGNRTLTVEENTASATNIGNPFTATDEDDDTLTYRLVGSDAGFFSINGSSGQLRTSAVFDYEEDKHTYTVTVSVFDGNDGSASINVTITVDDVNDAPVFVAGSLTRRIAENTVAGTNIGAAFTATDPDAGDTLEYSLDGTDASSFDIDSSSGQLKVKAALDYEDKTSYSVRITVSDGDLTDRISVTIRVTDVDDNRAPVFSQDSFTLRIEIDDETAAGDDIGRAFSATDADNNTLTYRLGGTDASSFSIVSSSGQLQTTAALISGTRVSYSITVIADDGNGGSDKR